MRAEAIQAVAKLTDERRADQVRAELQAQANPNGPDHLAHGASGAGRSRQPHREQLDAHGDAADLPAGRPQARRSTPPPSAVRPPQAAAPLTTTEQQRTMLMSDSSIAAAAPPGRSGPRSSTSRS